MKVCIDHYPPLQILKDEPKGESIEALEVFSKAIEQFIIANPELYSNADPFSNNE